MRIAILTPTALPNTTGNAITTERWRKFLSEKGAVVKVIETNQISASDFISSLDSFGPHLIHAHHISRSGALMLDQIVEERYGSLPLIVSPAGTDVNNYGVKGTEGETVKKICQKARFIVAQSAEISRRLKDLLPEIAGRILYIAKTYAWFGNDVYNLRSKAGFSRDDLLFFMPAGIRPVKGNLECLLALEEAHAANMKIRAIFAGPELDRTYANQFGQEIQRLHSFAQWIQIPLGAMRSAYEEADVVVNYSSSEGLSNSLLEAVAAAKPILASNIPGNLWLTNGDSPCAYLFNLRDRADFVHKALQFTESHYRESLAAAARLRASKLPQPIEEAHALLELYKSALP
jgi:glycosyltransferase involved in cell wall biosynthesis